MLKNPEFLNTFPLSCYKFGVSLTWTDSMLTGASVGSYVAGAIAVICLYSRASCYSLVGVIYVLSSKYTYKNLDKKRFLWENHLLGDGFARLFNGLVGQRGVWGGFDSSFALLQFCTFDFSVFQKCKAEGWLPSGSDGKEMEWSDKL